MALMTGLALAGEEAWLERALPAAKRSADDRNSKKIEGETDFMVVDVVVVRCNVDL
jgi:hypothetical protein